MHEDRVARASDIPLFGDDGAALDASKEPLNLGRCQVFSMLILPCISVSSRATCLVTAARSSRTRNRCKIVPFGLAKSIEKSRSSFPKLQVVCHDGKMDY
jgi:hypothetical protein